MEAKTILGLSINVSGIIILISGIAKHLVNEYNNPV